MWRGELEECCECFNCTSNHITGMVPFGPCLTMENIKNRWDIVSVLTPDLFIDKNILH